MLELQLQELTERVGTAEVDEPFVASESAAQIERFAGSRPRQNRVLRIPSSAEPSTAVDGSAKQVALAKPLVRSAWLSAADYARRGRSRQAEQACSRMPSAPLD